MKKLFICVLVLFSFKSYTQTNYYEKAWDCLSKNERANAEAFLQKAMIDSNTSQDAYITNLYLKTYNEKEDEITDFPESFYKKSADPYPYIYALWFNKAVLGDYGKKSAENELNLMDALINDPNAPGTLVAAANYQKGMHLLYSDEFDKANQYYKAVGNIADWQFAGPFENLSGSGFYKDYGPLEHPEPNAVFKSLTNADVKWFTPPSEDNGGWTPVIYQFNKNTAIVYAQSFVNSPIDQTVLCNIGCSGTIKAWINDELVISDSKSRNTELDNYSVRYHLKKGVNRVLIQLGFTDLSYPKFSLRFTDKNYRPIANITGSSAYAPYPKKLNSHTKYELIPQFAEQYFKDKTEHQPGNPVNYLLLADCYLRGGRLLDARDVISKALAQSPQNSLLRMKMLEILQEQKNNTLFLEELEKIKQSDPESAFVMDLNIKELYNNEKYEDCEAALEKRIALHGENETTAGFHILLLIKDKKYDELVNVVKKLYDKYPENIKLLTIMYNIKKDVDKDNKGALKLYEKYMKNNYNYDTFSKYADILIEQGDTRKGLDIKEKLAKDFPYSPTGFYNLSQYYFSAKKYDKAQDYITQSLALSPYDENYWEQLGDIKSQENDVAGALEAYNQSLKFDPNQYDIISKIRKLNNKPDIYKLFPEVDVDKVIKEDDTTKAKNTDYGYYYILNQKNMVVYPDGANEEYSTIIIKITNDKGVERYKETSIGYNNSQNLLIEKAEIIKPDQTKIDGDRNDNDIVFTNLQAGDIIVLKYRLQSYVYGRFEKEFWDKYYFSSQIYSADTKYNLLIPETQKINYIFSNSHIQPVIKNIENFKLYSWEVVNQEPLKDEPLMPLSTDIGNVLHLSTIPSWNEIANWYSDISNNKSEEDFEILALYKKLFPDTKKSMSQFEKAKIIYDYIESNIRYSSVSFRQSAFVPQRASTTLTTRLGDCKDLSNLFVTLARMAGINAQMVLVDTRDNGQKDILLPSVEFNHCIAKAVLDNKSYYIELTDNYLPFTSLPNVLNGAIALEIPYRSVTENAALIHLKSTDRVKDVIKRVIEMKPDEDNMNVKINTVKYGAFTSDVRGTYGNLDHDKEMQEMEKSTAGSYKNNVRLEDVSFGNLSKLNDSVTYSYSYQVENEVAEIGSLKTFKIVYPDIVASLNNFSADKRIYPIEYWNYENADDYETTVNITAPAGMKFVELPKGETLSFKDLKYSIKYNLKSPGELIVTRKFSDGREQQILPGDYVAFKNFFEKIVRAEQKFIAYK